MKKKISALLVCAMLFSICAMSGYALGPDGSNEAYEELPISAQEGQKILSEFSAEISYAEETYGLSITELDRETFESLKVVAVQNLNNENYDFPGLIDTISIACEQNNLQNAPTVANEGGPMPRSTVTTEVVRSFGVLCGQHFAPVPVGTELSSSLEATVVISAGTEVGVDGIIADGVSGSGTITLTVEFTRKLEQKVIGPSDGTKLCNGMYATDRIYYDIMYGTVVKETREYPMTGLITTDYKILGSSVSVVPKTILASTGYPTYAENTHRDKIFIFNDQFALFDKIRYFPETFI